MAVYDKNKYLEEVTAARDNYWKMSFAPIDQLQAFARSLSDADPPPGIEKTIFPAQGQDDALDALLKVVGGLNQADAQYARPVLADVPAEWSVPKQGAGIDSPTLLYVHGGGFIYGSPATARRNTKKLVELTRGRCITPQYRKAPENTFPATLLDVFVVYLSLLAPPKGSSHQAVPAAKLVFAGESSGLNLLMALIQVILYLRKHSASTVRFQGQDVKLELPAAVAGMCGFFDITCGLPSWSQKADFDVLPKIQPTYMPEWKTQVLWPTDPPRADLYCEKSAMTHPLLSPVTAATWAGSPPFYIAAAGEEMNRDGNLYLAQLAASQGVPVCFKQYEDMIHVWSTAFPKLPHSAHVMESWASFIRTAVQGTPVQTSAESVSFDTLQARPLDISKLTDLTREDVLKMTAKAQQERLVLRRTPESKM